MTGPEGTLGPGGRAAGQVAKRVLRSAGGRMTGGFKLDAVCWPQLNSSGCQIRCVIRSAI